MKITRIENPARDRIQRLIQASKSYPTMGDLELQFDSEGTFAVVHRRDAKTVAGAIAVISKNWAYVEAVWVDASLRGQGIGFKLMRAVESYVYQLGLNGILLYTIDFQAPDFYRKLGYEQIGILPNRPTPQNATYFRKTKFIADALTPDFEVENPVTEKTFDEVDGGLVEDVMEQEPINFEEGMIELQSADGQVCGGAFWHQFWGYMDVHLLYAEDENGLQMLIDAVKNYCAEQKIGAVIHAFSDAQRDILLASGYEKFAELPDRPTGATCNILVYPQP